MDRYDSVQRARWLGPGQNNTVTMERLIEIDIEINRKS